ncbi:MAG: hypothetical protein LBF39_00130 [Prevotellaceae bacterium]|nr:hypothetical protein [Prevotellaceae bacterium]
MINTKPAIANIATTVPPKSIIQNNDTLSFIIAEIIAPPNTSLDKSR